MKNVINCSSTRVVINSPGRCFKSKLAALLVAWANRLDDQQAFIGLTMQSSPPVSGETKVQCIKKGLEHAARLFADEVRSQHVENLFEKTLPPEFDDA